MNTLKHDNFYETVKSTIAECENQLLETEQTNYAMKRDFQIAIEALRGIYEELNVNKASRPKGLRSGAFSRYVVDEGEQMAMDETMRHKIMEIEDFYNRKW